MFNTVRVCPLVSQLRLEVSNSHSKLLRSLLQAAAVVVCDGPLVVLRGVYVLGDSRVLVAAVVVAAHLLGVVQELPGKQRLHLKHTEVRRVSFHCRWFVRAQIGIEISQLMSQSFESLNCLEKT